MEVLIYYEDLNDIEITNIFKYPYPIWYHRMYISHYRCPSEIRKEDDTSPTLVYLVQLEIILDTSNHVVSEGKVKFKNTLACCDTMASWVTFLLIVCACRLTEGTFVALPAYSRGVSQTGPVESSTKVGMSSTGLVEFLTSTCKASSL